MEMGKEETKWKRLHGKELIRRHDISSATLPPTDTIPPRVGKALPEQTQHFVGK